MANGWTPERRARQAALIRTWKPWERSTGARTAAGKARSSRNADQPESFNRQMRALKKEVATIVSQAREIRAHMQKAPPQQLDNLPRKQKNRF